MQHWLIVVMGDYLVDIILLMVQYDFLKKHHRESLLLIGVRFLLSCFLVSWLIYGNVFYYRYETECSKSASGLTLVMFLVLLLGYFEMLKCCCIGTCICVMIPVLYYQIRRS